MKEKVEFVLQITETGRENLKVPAQSFNCIVEYFKTIPELKQYLIDRYGKIPNQRKKIYQANNGKIDVIGFLYSYWNQDISHMSRKWYQTDWIEFCQRETKDLYFKLK